jgi:transposase
MHPLENLKDVQAIKSLLEVRRMLPMQDFVKIRELHFKDGWGIKKIRRTFGYAKETIRKAIREWDGQLPKYHLSKARPRPASTPEVCNYVRGILEADKRAPRKQRHTARRIFRRIQREKQEWRIGESTVRGVVRQIRQEMRERPPVTVPLAFEPGEEAQVDFGEAWVTMGGEQVKAHLLIVTLCYSRRTFVMGFPSPNQEAFLEGQVRAFRHFGGSPGRLAYDNLTSAVKKILPGNGREENPTFTAFRSLYKFEPRYCSPGQEGAHEKGRVERRVGSFRAGELVPLPEVESWAALNKYLLGRCLELDAHQHPEFRDCSVLEAFEEERAHLGALPRHDFVCAKYRCTRVDGQGRVVFEQVHYSVPCEHGRREVELRAFWDRVEVYHGTDLVASWPRSYTPGEEHYDYRHYLKLLRFAPGASLNGKPFRGLPEVLLRYRKELLSRQERRQAGRSFAAVLGMLLEHPENPVLEGVELAMLCGTVDSEAVRSLVHQLLYGPPKPVKRLDLANRPSLNVVNVTPLDLTSYNRLIGGLTS